MYKHFMIEKKAIVFDMDGTIFNNYDAWTEAFNEILRLENGYEVKINTFRFHGIPVDKTWDYLISNGFIMTKQKISDLAEHTYKAYLTKLDLIEYREGFWQLYQHIKEDLTEIKIALATNTEKAVAMQVLKHFGMQELFDLMVFGDEVSHTKPHPEIYRTVAKKLGCRPENLLVFEDSPPGVLSAVRAGAPVIAIVDGSTPEAEYSTKALAYFPDFEPLVGNLNRTIQDIVRAQEAAGELGEDGEDIDLETENLQTMEEPESPAVTKEVNQ